jgi:hypothetical protein
MQAGSAATANPDRALLFRHGNHSSTTAHCIDTSGTLPFQEACA